MSISLTSLLYPFLLGNSQDVLSPRVLLDVAQLYTFTTLKTDEPPLAFSGANFGSSVQGQQTLCLHREAVCKKHSMVQSVSE